MIFEWISFIPCRTTSLRVVFFILTHSSNFSIVCLSNLNCKRMSFGSLFVLLFDKSLVHPLLLICQYKYKVCQYKSQHFFYKKWKILKLYKSSWDIVKILIVKMNKNCTNDNEYYEREKHAQKIKQMRILGVFSLITCYIAR